LNKSDNIILGKQGEEQAVNYLQKNGYIILDKRWKYKRFEIDIIAKNQSTLIFLEVKTRRNPIISINEIVSNAQKDRIINTAHHYILSNEIDLNIRFDLIYIDYTQKTFNLKHFKEFFTPYFD
tara:strand:+ start:588 stop:956 length:369 start_codon:yes stop_codon:yes gene_type:complete